LPRKFQNAGRQVQAVSRTQKQNAESSRPRQVCRVAGRNPDETCRWQS